MTQTCRPKIPAANHIYYDPERGLRLPSPHFYRVWHVGPSRFLVINSARNRHYSVEMQDHAGKGSCSCHLFLSQTHYQPCQHIRFVLHQLGLQSEKIQYPGAAPQPAAHLSKIPEAIANAHRSEMYLAAEPLTELDI